MNFYIGNKNARVFANYCWLAIFFLMVSCAPSVKEAVKVAELPEIYPDYIGVTIPAEIAPMNFCMADESFENIFVEVKGTKGGSLQSKTGFVAKKGVAQFDMDDWHSLTKQNLGGELSFTVFGQKQGEWKEFEPFTMTISEKPLTDYGITYRKIAPGFETFSNIGIYQRCLSTFDEEAIFDVKDVDGQCMNCHYANRANPEQYLVHVRGKHGATLVHNGNKDTYLNTKTPETCGSCTYGYWHPEGKYCAFSLNKAKQNFYTGDKKIIEPWDLASDISVLDVDTNELIRTPLLEGEAFQTTPAFSADGKTIYFCAAEAKDMPAEYLQVKYNLCAISFDATTGTFGNSVDTILNARLIDKSIGLPRPSYDGKFLMYCLSDYGTTPINRIEADLWIMNLATGETRKMDEVNSAETDAYHNWSTSSAWFVFGSKREDHYYSLPYFACVDENGIATKPFLLPQEDPREYYLESLYSFNVPDFTSGKVSLDRKEFSTQILEGERIQVTCVSGVSK